jgi:gentisate 1,2-dioxygenase
VSSDPRELVATASRVLAAAGHSDLIWGHASVRDPDDRGVWIKQSSWGFSEITPARVHLVDADGSVLSGDGLRHSEYPIHTEIMAARPDVGGIVHTHSRDAVALAASGMPVRPVSHEGSFFHPPGVPRFTRTTDLILTRELGVEVAAALADASALFLLNHGIVCVGPDLQTATVTAILLERACRQQLLTYKHGSSPTWTDDAEALAKRDHISAARRCTPSGTTWSARCPHDHLTDWKKDMSASLDTELDNLYADFAAANMMPLWTQRDDLMTETPQPKAVAAIWHWSTLYPLAQRAGELVPVGRGGERRAIALANPGLSGEPYATPTLWAAIQYLGPGEFAPSHRHSQTAFRFIIDGDGVWTNVEGDAVAMRRGDLLLTPSWHFHEHHNTTDQPMAWVDGLDIPLVSQLDAGFFEYGPDELSTRATPFRSRGERLWAYPGLRPVNAGDHPSSPLMAYRWQHTDRALRAQLDLEAEGNSNSVEPGHAPVRFTNPTTGKDALRTIRTEMHRYTAGTATTPTRVVGSAVWQIFNGNGVVEIGTQRFEVRRNDLIAIPSWAPVTVHAASELDVFRFSDDPVYEAFGLDRTERSVRP